MNMKASVALALLVICAVPAVAQKNKKEIVMPELPKNESTGLISYAGKEEVATIWATANSRWPRSSVS